MSCHARVFALGLILMLGGNESALAQSGGGPAAPPDAATPGTVAPPSLELSESQRQVLFASISSKTHRSTAAPANFLPKLGDVVPPGIETQPVPDAAVELIPKLRGFDCALIANQALIVDPKSRQIIEIVSGGGAATPPRG
jgi:hypothetical protein